MKTVVNKQGLNSFPSGKTQLEVEGEFIIREENTVESYNVVEYLKAFNSNFKKLESTFNTLKTEFCNFVEQTVKQPSNESALETLQQAELRLIKDLLIKNSKELSDLNTKWEGKFSELEKSLKDYQTAQEEEQQSEKNKILTNRFKNKKQKQLLLEEAQPTTSNNDTP